MPIDFKIGTPEVQVYSVKHLDDLIKREKHIFRLMVRDHGAGHDICLTVRPKGFFANWTEHTRESDFGYDMLSHVLGEWQGKYNATVYCIDPDWSAHEIAQEISVWGT